MIILKLYTKDKEIINIVCTYDNLFSLSYIFDKLKDILSYSAIMDGEYLENQWGRKKWINGPLKNL